MKGGGGQRAREEAWRESREQEVKSKSEERLERRGKQV